MPHPFSSSRWRQIVTGLALCILFASATARSPGAGLARDEHHKQWRRNNVDASNKLMERAPTGTENDHEYAKRALTFTPKPATTSKAAPTSTSTKATVFFTPRPATTTTPQPTSTCFPAYNNAPYTISATGTLPKPTTFATRSYSQIQVNGQAFRPVGPNMYWLGLDENVVPNPSYPSKQRIREAMAIAVAMGANTIRAHTLGISVGCPLCIEPSLGYFNNQAFDIIDYALFAAREYGLRVIIPLGDNWDYYHGGKYTFLRWLGVSQDNYGAAFYTDGNVINAFKTYINKIITHQNAYTGVRYADDPTILAWQVYVTYWHNGADNHCRETGNEWGGYMGQQGWPPLSWTNNIGGYIKSLDSKHLLLDGSDGFYNYNGGATSQSLGSGYIDIMGDHAYPLNNYIINQEKPLATREPKGFFVSEFDWTGRNGGDDLGSFISNIESNNYMGDLVWSVFGHDDQCCNYVQHNDGYSLYYPNGNSYSDQSRILQIVQHWHRMSGRAVPNALPGVACPQRAF